VNTVTYLIEDIWWNSTHTGDRRRISRATSRRCHRRS